VDLLPHILRNSRIWVQFKPRKGAIATNTPLRLTIKVSGCLHKHVDVFLHDYANVIWSLKETKCFHLSSLVTLSSKSFDHITKDASIFHLKSGNGCSLSYFLTSIPSRHTSHHHGRSISSSWFFTCKYGRPSTSGRLWTCIDFHSKFEPTWCHVTSPFSFVLFLCTFP
jgi:hypothetical protein